MATADVRFIGITGPSACGKTGFSNYVLESIIESPKYDNNSVLVISQDWFYKGLSSDQLENVQDYNFDTPDAIDSDEFYSVLAQIKNGESDIVTVPVYSFKKHKREGYRQIDVSKVKMVLVEGIFTLWYSSIRELLDVKIFIDVDLDVCLSRRIERDIKERNRDLGFVLLQWKETTKLGFVNFTEPSKRYADVIIPNSSDDSLKNNRGFRCLHVYLEGLLS